MVQGSRTAPHIQDLGKQRNMSFSRAKAHTASMR
jgi:hypothetical protein